MTIEKLKEEVKDELENNILPFWMTRMVDKKNGGFYGRISGDGITYADAPKGAILNGRILWAFSAAYRVLKKDEYLRIATYAKQYITDHFIDKQYGGIYWSLNAYGTPFDTKKQMYALGFVIYGMSEYARATGDKEALDCAVKLFHDIESHSFDKEKNGYLEATTRDWHEIEDMRLSAKDANEKKTMNTHLHILESYTNLYRLWKDDLLKTQLGNLIDIFLDYILDKQTNHLNLFFDENWASKYKINSFGHDIEASWLLYEAGLVLGDEERVQRIKDVVPSIVGAASEGLMTDGGLIDEINITKERVIADKDWWVQCEAVIGFANLYQYYHDSRALTQCFNSWNFIKNHIIDKVCGEWFWSMKADGTTNVKDDKAGFWKCPYHNTRMCLEIIERF